MRTTTRVVVELRIGPADADDDADDDDADAAALAAFADALRAVADLPGATVTPLPSPRILAPSTSDIGGRLRIVPHARVVLRDGRPVRLTRLEFDLLLFLCRHPGRVYARRTLLAEVWGMAEPPFSRTVDVHVRRLRDKLGADLPLITTVRGVGYRLDGDELVVVEPAGAGVSSPA